jgi:predicted RNA-binding protein YlqC (UPF0109 family)
MKEVLETIIKNLVDNQESIKIEEAEDEKNIIFKVQVADGDMGKIIGRQGKIAQSIRTVMKAVANRKDKKVNVEFIDD